MPGRVAVCDASFMDSQELHTGRIVHSVHYIWKLWLVAVSAQFYSPCVLSVTCKSYKAKEYVGCRIVHVNFLKILSLLCVAYRRGPFYWHLWTEILCAILTLRASVFWDVTQRVLLASYRRFETTYRSHMQGWTRTMMVRITILCSVKSQKIADLTS